MEQVRFSSSYDDVASETADRLNHCAELLDNSADENVDEATQQWIKFIAEQLTLTSSKKCSNLLILWYGHVNVVIQALPATK